MSFLLRRNAHLDKKLNLEVRNPEYLPENRVEVVPAKKEETSLLVEGGESYEDAIKESQLKMEQMYAVAEGVLQSAADIAESGAKSRDFEAFAGVLDKMTALQDKIMLAKEKRLKREKAKEEVPSTAIQNNQYIVSSTRELNDLLKNSK